MIRVEEKDGMVTARGFNCTCPFCGYRTDSATATCGTERKCPLPGDASICINCAEVSFFTEAGLRKPRDEEKLAIMQDVDILTAQAQVRALPPRRRQT